MHKQNILATTCKIERTYIIFNLGEKIVTQYKLIIFQMIIEKIVTHNPIAILPRVKKERKKQYRDKEKEEKNKQTTIKRR